MHIVRERVIVILVATWTINFFRILIAQRYIFSVGLSLILISISDLAIIYLLFLLYFGL